MQGADFNNASAQNGQTLVAAIARSRNIEITETIVDHGMDINAIQNGETILTLAANSRNYTHSYPSLCLVRNTAAIVKSAAAT